MFERAAESSVAGARNAFVEIQRGLALQVVDLQTEQRQFRHVAVPPSLGLSVVLRGEAQLRCGRHRVRFGARSEGRGRLKPQASLFRAVNEIELARQVDVDVHIRHLSLTATPEWLERSGLGAYAASAPVFDGAFDHSVWTPSGRIIALSEQLLRASEADVPLQKLRRESQVLDLVAQTLLAFGRAPQHHVSNARVLRRLQLVRECLESENAEPPTVEGLARAFGMSVDTLQRQFRAAFGTTLFGYLQEHRLQRSYRAIEAGSPISTAAYAAGYASPANFSTAFKRRFGVAPREVRRPL